MLETNFGEPIVREVPSWVTTLWGRIQEKQEFGLIGISTSGVEEGPYLDCKEKNTDVLHDVGIPISLYGFFTKQKLRYFGHVVRALVTG